VVFLFFSYHRSLKLKSDITDFLIGKCAEDCLESPTLIGHIKSLIVQPSGTKPNLENEESTNSRGQHNQVDIILNHLNNKRDGFFIEAGAWDGEVLSNSLHLETHFGWKGLLVEPNEGAFEAVISKKRNAFAINCCLSNKRNAERVMFDMADVYGAIDDPDNPYNADIKKNKIDYKAQGLFANTDIPHQNKEVQCLPLYSILLAIDNPKVDFFSLDVEGSEMDVLKTIPWDKVDIELILIETAFVNITEMVTYMSENGYRASEVPPLDYLFIKQ